MASFPACFLLTIALGAALSIEIWPPILPAGTRISNGKPALPRQLPYMADILATKDSGSGSRVCGGSLISRTAVLTHGFCTKDHHKWTVRLGSITHTGEDSNAWTAVSRWALPHPDYNHINGYSDIAIIYLPTKAPLTDYIRPVDLPISPDVGSFLGMRAIVSGFLAVPDSGMSETLLWASVVVIPNDICEEYLTTTKVTERSLCAGGVTSNASPGDGGAPLVIKTRSGYMQIGVYNRGGAIISGNSTEPSHYTRVSSLIDWIKQKSEPEQ